MSTMNISLPNALKTFVDDQVNQRGYSTSSEYVRELIRKDQDRQIGHQRELQVHLPKLGFGPINVLPACMTCTGCHVF